LKSRLSSFFVRPARAGLRSFSVHDRQNVLPSHERLRQARCHCRRNPQRLVNAEPVVPNGVDRDHVSMVLEFLGEGVRQAREAAVVHPHREVGTLGIGRGDVRHVWRPFDWRLDAGAVQSATHYAEAKREVEKSPLRTAQSARLERGAGMRRNRVGI
jgi:hypothetical protein